MTFRTLLMMAAFLAPMVGLAADEKANEKRQPDLVIAVKVGKSTSVIVKGAHEVRTLDRRIADVVMGETNQVMVEGLTIGETSAQILRKGEPTFLLVVQVIR